MYLDNFNTLGIHFRIVFLSLFDYSYERNDNLELKLKKNFNFFYDKILIIVAIRFTFTASHWLITFIHVHLRGHAFEFVFPWTEMDIDRPVRCKLIAVSDKFISNPIISDATLASSRKSTVLFHRLCVCVCMRVCDAPFGYLSNNHSFPVESGQVNFHFLPLIRFATPNEGQFHPDFHARPRKSPSPPLPITKLLVRYLLVEIPNRKKLQSFIPHLVP